MIWHRKHRWLGYVLRHDNLLHDIIEGKMLGKATRRKKKDGIAGYDGRERLWTVERCYLRQIKMETGQQVREYVINLLETAEY